MRAKRAGAAAAAANAADGADPDAAAPIPVQRRPDGPLQQTIQMRSIQDIRRNMFRATSASASAAARGVTEQENTLLSAKSRVANALLWNADELSRDSVCSNEGAAAAATTTTRQSTRSSKDSWDEPALPRKAKRRRENITSDDSSIEEATHGGGDDDDSMREPSAKRAKTHRPKTEIDGSVEEGDEEASLPSYEPPPPHGRQFARDADAEPHNACLLCTGFRYKAPNWPVERLLNSMNQFIEDRIRATGEVDRACLEIEDMLKVLFVRGLEQRPPIRLPFMNYDKINEHFLYHAPNTLVWLIRKKQDIALAEAKLESCLFIVNPDLGKEVPYEPAVRAYAALINQRHRLNKEMDKYIRSPRPATPATTTSATLRDIMHRVLNSSDPKTSSGKSIGRDPNAHAHGM